MNRTWLVPGLFATTLLLSSFLLFLVQPMQGKLLLPLLGGTPAVWNTCMVFFQAVLLLGYLYAHGVATRLSPRTQAILHVVVLGLPLAFVPPLLSPSLTQSPLLTSSPVTWVVMALALSSGPVFFAVSTTSPLLQAWFSRTGQKSSANPYVLYAAGNVGSLLALVGYPFAIEPFLRLQDQLRLWSWGYGLLVVLIAAVAFVTLRLGNHAPPTPSAVEGRPVRTPWRESARWIAHAFVPSSLMMGVTSFITTDLASIPLLWLLPLTLYVLSFVIVFGRYSERMQRIALRLLPVLLAATLFLVFADYHERMWAIITTHLATFFVAAVACHGRLALDRPEPARLTAFYFCMSLGGVLGGVFNSLIAPLIFSRVAEYPLLLAACLLIADRPRGERSARERVALIGAFITFAIVAFGFGQLQSLGISQAVANALADRFDKHVVKSVIVFGLPMLAAIPLIRQSRPFGAALFGITLVALTISIRSGTIVLRERSFFGVVTVASQEDPSMHVLVHGGILHGEQRLDSDTERQRARTYYHREGPLGQVLSELEKRVDQPRIAGIGLGVGTLAAYGTPKNTIAFYELDPNVERVARDPRYFTYIDDCLKRGCHLTVDVGDGRLRLQQSTQQFDLIVVDAFSSDAIPVHLLTTEAMQIYLSKLSKGGVLAFHITNEFVNLRPVLHNLALSQRLTYAFRADDGDPALERRPSEWAIVTREQTDLASLANDQRWSTSEPPNDLGVWSDDYARVAKAFVWFDPSP